MCRKNHKNKRNHGLTRYVQAAEEVVGALILLVQTGGSHVVPDAPVHASGVRASFSGAR